MSSLNFSNLRRVSIPQEPFLMSFRFDFKWLDVKLKDNSPLVGRIPIDGLPSAGGLLKST